MGAPPMHLPVKRVENTLSPVSTIPALSLRGLTKHFSVRSRIKDLVHGRRGTIATVVDGVSFDVHPGEVFGILGPNGAGKTTIFKMLSTMILPDDGEAWAYGNNIWRSPTAIRGMIASVPADERSLNWRLSSRENLLLFSSLYGLAGDAATRRVDEVLEAVGLSDTGAKLVAAFSSGMRQRLLIARALLSRPRILLLDEPTRALDPMAAKEFRTFLRDELVARERCTIVLATHNTDEALSFCDRVLVLHHGRVLAIGAATELAERFSEERYRLHTMDATHEAFATLERHGRLQRFGTQQSPVSGWWIVDCAIPGALFGSATVLNVLLESGVRVARLERVETSVADLIERIIGSAGEPKGHA